MVRLIILNSVILKGIILNADILSVEAPLYALK
jgi:hypothetical protein